MMLTPLSETPTPEETALEGLLAAYLEEVAAHGLTPADAETLEALVHTKGPPRVIALHRGPGEGTKEAPYIAAPGVGLFAFTKQERAELLRLTKEHYAAPGTDPAALLDLYDKTRRTLQQRKAERASLGWAKIPTWTEWATAKGEDRRGVSYGAARLGEGWTSSLRLTEDGTYRISEDTSYPIWRPETIEGVLAILEAAEAQTAKPRRDNAPRSLRQGSAFLESITHGALTYAKGVRRKQQTKAAKAALAHEELGLVPEEEGIEIIFTEATREGLELFHTDYEPLTWGQRWALTALANMAAADKRLEDHPSALSIRPDVTMARERVRIPFPGYTEMARWCGARPDADGKMPRDLTRALKTAMGSLTEKARVIVEPVVVREGKYLKNKYMVDKDLWVKMVSLIPADGGGRAEVWVDLHPVAVGSILRSYVERGPDLYERHKAAQKALGAREMRNEWAALEEYLLRRALVAAGAAFTKSLPEGARKGKAKKDARAAAKLALTNRGPTEGERTVAVDISRTRLWELLKLDAMVRDRGRKYVLQREAEAFQFCKLTGTLLAVAERLGKTGDLVFICTMPHPDRGRHDPAQLTMLPSVSGIEAIA